jgi:hypothetical protein
MSIDLAREAPSQVDAILKIIGDIKSGLPLPTLFDALVTKVPWYSPPTIGLIGSLLSSYHRSMKQC